MLNLFLPNLFIGTSRNPVLNISLQFLNQSFCIKYACTRAHVHTHGYIHSSKVITYLSNTVSSVNIRIHKLKQWIT